MHSLVQPARRIGLAALVAASVLTAPASAAGPPGFVGLSSEDVFHGSAGYRSDNLARQHAAGVRLLRQNFDWAAFEKSPGEYSFAEYDSYVAATARAGIRILPVLYHAPDFHTDAPAGARYLYPPRNPQSMADFAAALVGRYGPGGSFWSDNPDVPVLPIRAWQVWNEPSLTQYWQPRPDPAAYAELLKTVGPAIKSADPGAEVVTAGLPPSLLGDAIRLAPFIRALYDAGAGGSFDTIAINSYAPNTKKLAALMRSVRRILRQKGDGAKRIWITELGWANGGPAHRFNLGTRGQARMTSKAVRWVIKKRKALRLRGFVYFQWRDQKPYPPEFKDMWGLHTGLLTLDGASKPALRSFRGAARTLNKRPKRRR